MKKLYSLIGGMLLSAHAFSQATITQNLPPITVAGTSANRAPNGTTAHTTLRAHFLIPASELATLPSGTQITQLGFIYATGVNTAATGTINFYLENTANTTNTKSTTWATAIAPMSPVYNGTFAIPIGTTTPGTSDATLGTPFTYTGGGIYVAYDWLGGSFATTAAVYQSDQSIPGALFNGVSATTTPPATLTATSAFRPQMRFGYNNPNSNDMAVLSISVDKGHENTLFTNSQTVTAVVKNASNTGLTNVNVMLNVTGANATSTSTLIPSLTAGATSTLTFSGLAVTANGAQTLAVSVPTDQVSSNNAMAYQQVISCDTLGYSDNSAPFDGIGFNTGAGLLLTRFTAPPRPITITGVNVGIATATTSIGKAVYGVAVARNGTILAASPSVTLAAGDIGKDKAFMFTTGVNMSADSIFFVGLAQTAGTPGYFPVGTQYPQDIPANQVYSMPLAGGTTTAQTNYTNLGRLMIEALVAGHPELTSSAPTGMVCSGQPVTYTASTGYSNYDFSNNGSSVQNSASNTYSFTVTAPATVAVVSMYNGCTSPATTATVGLAPPSATVNASASSASVCSAQNVTLTATGATSYTWMPGGLTTAGITITAPVVSSPPGSTVTYTVSGTDGCGVVTQTVSFYVNPAPIMSISPTSATICTGESATLTAGSAPNYTWSTSAQPTTVLSTSASYVATPTITTTYMVRGTYGANCFGAGLATITVNACTGIEEAAALAGISLYPNPNSGEVTVELRNGLAGKCSIEVFDALGKLVISEKLGHEHTLLNTSRLEAGIYIYKIYNNGSAVTVGRMVKQ